MENELKTIKVNLSSKEDQLITVQKSLDRERDEKMALLDEKNKEEGEFLAEKRQWQTEKQEMKEQVTELMKVSQTAKVSEETNQAFNKVLCEKESLESENSILKQEIKRLQLIVSSPHEIDQMKSSMFSSNDEDFGYSSSRNTLEKHHQKHKSSSQINEGEFHSIQNSTVQNSSSTSIFERKFKSLFGFSNRGGNKKKIIFNW